MLLGSQNCGGAWGALGDAELTWDDFRSLLECSWAMNLCFQLLKSSIGGTLTVLVLLWNCLGAPRLQPVCIPEIWTLIPCIDFLRSSISHSKTKNFCLHNRKQKSNSVDGDQCALLSPHIALDDVVIPSHLRNSPACKLLGAS